MGIPYKFEKILMIKQKEKEQVQIDYELSVQSFEKEANKLYEVLKRKEMVEEQKQQNLQKGVSIDGLKQQLLFVEALEKDIKHSQLQVINARNHMNTKQEVLIEHNVEVKKYEKMREKAIKSHSEILLSLENKQMDEISLQQFVNRNV
ncbi:flagellar export protein FliJ [Bacillus sp. RG28]|uniref:Flagellar FliJ protein n=1 Tax=Gottfriedia endophytica TaxID=2820819 RepID=A0A940NWH5_9BACI|nr:flagellar export protein FliJ [Gottfriedia endophytica]MBP0726238.1 flagellar export protein FliJ [Gottfriedia endophytica]